MTGCAIDWKAYVLGEMNRRESEAAEAHTRLCATCRDEVERLQLTAGALRSLPEEEIPRRIAFVSDRVFEPRWWQTMWRSGPVMGFASAVVLALAILVHGFARPVAVKPQPLDTAAIEQRIEQRIERRIQARTQEAVAQAVADLQARNAAETARAVHAAEARIQARNATELAQARDAIQLYQQQMGRLLVAWNSQGDGK